MTASPITLRACIPAPDQVTPEQAYFKDLNFYKKTLFHTPFLSRGRAVTLLEYRDAKIVFEVDDWFRTLPQGVQRYLLPLQSKYARWYDENVRDLTQNYSYCVLCKTKQTNLQHHHMQHHARWRTIWFCPIPGCPLSLANKEGLVKHLISRPHGRGIDIKLGHKVAKQIVNQNCFWPVTQVMAEKLLVASKRLIRYIRSCHGDQIIQNSPERKRHAIYGCLRSLPDSKDEPESGYAERMQSPQIRASTKKSTRS